jgi:hypothetical protein
MNNLFLKGTATGFDYKKSKDDRELQSSLLLSVMNTWLINTYNTQDKLIIEISDQQEREYGVIKAALWGFEGDIHNLAVNHHLLTSLLNNRDLSKGLKSLYTSLLVENFIINLRSIYDFCSVFPRIIMSLKDIQQYKKRKNADSLNTFINYCEQESSKDLPNDLRHLMKNARNEFENIKTIRDLIIHKGKESIIQIKENETVFRMPSKPPYGKGNALPDIHDLGNSDYPLMEYLRTLTLTLFEFIEKLGTILIMELKNNVNYRLEFTVLVGICIKDFNNFLYPDKN